MILDAHGRGAPPRTRSLGVAVRTRRIVLAGVTVAMLAATGAACSDTDETAGDSSGPAETETTEPATPAEPVDDDDPVDESTDDESDSDGDGVECLVGDWVATSESLTNWYEQFLSASGAEISGVTGEVLVSFSDTEFIYSTAGLQMDLELSGQRATAVSSGGVAGTYRVTAPGVMASTIEASDLDVAVEAAGIRMTAAELGLDLSGAGAFVGFDCLGSNLIVSTQSAGPGISTYELIPAT